MAKTRSNARKKAPVKSSRPPGKPAASELPKEVEEHFAAGVLTRGEAVPAPAGGGGLPPGTTHTTDGKTIKRRRFSVL
jgi:hypothetical protein